MNFSKNPGAAAAIAIVFWTGLSRAQVSGPATNGDSMVLTAENKVEAQRAGSETWTAASTNQVLHARDRIRTAIKSRATVRLSDQSVLRMNQLTTVEIQPAPEGKKAILDLKAGAAYFYNREKPTEAEFRTPTASGAIRGTEFNLAVDENGKTVITLLDGAVNLKNELGELNLLSGEQGVVEPGQAPRKTASIDAINIIQWTLYYPGVLDVSELPLDAGVRGTLAGSIESYRAGDLLKALADYGERKPASTAEGIYAAAVNLAAGQVDEAESLLRNLDADRNATNTRLAGALRQLIAAVKGQEWKRESAPETASEFTAESYYQQSRGKLEEARQAARSAVAKSPEFGLGWERVAELEFSFGRTAEALEALEKSIRFSPRNAEALSLKGFLVAAQNHIAEARGYFDQAIALDGALGNAWLGRGLTQIRQGRAADGRQDLQTAAALEPNRAILRSYLGKAFANEGKQALSQKELDLAKKLDPNDPTSWLYAALLEAQNNRLNEGVRDLEKSKELNDNRRIFRSKLLLDQDRAVRGANLATLYRDNGMFDLSVREASRAVNYDYANYSAHLFLAESYDAVRDQKRINQRYGAPWLSELLIANLLAPVGAGSLSQNISQQEYSKLFESDRVGISSQTEYFSHGEWTEMASQFGTYGNSSYAMDVEYRSQRGFRPNNDLDLVTWYAKAKQQITPQDTLFFESIYFSVDGGDTAQYYDQATASKTQRYKERQEPLIFAGYHHEWQPGVQTLFLAGRLNDTFLRTDSAFQQTVMKVAPSFRADIYTFGVDYRTELEGYSAELQQIFEQGNNTLIAGAKYQAASSDTTSTLTRAPSIFLPNFNNPPAAQKNETGLERINVYAYDIFKLFDRVQLTLGVVYDRLLYPVNIDDPPISSRQKMKEQISPKAGINWEVCPDTFLRGYFTRSLGGVFFDTAVRLEPTQVAGFNQAYSSFIPESISGLVAGSRFENWGAALEHNFKSQTYVALEAELLDSTAERGLGAFTYTGLGIAPAQVGAVTERLIYQEKSIYATVNQLLGKEWSVGARYRLTAADLDHHFTAFPAPFNQADESAVLHQLNGYAILNLPCGFFSEADAIWSSQSNAGKFSLRGDDFWQFNLFAGYRFPNRHAEIKVGLLNLTDTDYKLNPLTLYNELPRERMLYVSAKFNF